MVISLSSITNLEAFDKPAIEYHRGNFLKHLRNLLIPELKEKLPNIARFIKTKGKRVQSNASIHLGKEGDNMWIRLFSHPYNGKIRLIFNFNIYICNATHGSVQEAIKTLGHEAELNAIETEFEKYRIEYKNFTPTKLYDNVRKSYNQYDISIHSYFVLPSIEAFYEPNNVNMLSNAISKKYITIKRLTELRNMIIKK